MSTHPLPRRHLLLPWAVQEREDPVQHFDHAEGMYFFDHHGHCYLDFLSQVFHCTLGHGNRRVIEAIVRQAQRACCASPQLLTEERATLAATCAARDC
jgi:taurine---2-oxoglutarate transaminase